MDLEQTSIWLEVFDVAGGSGSGDISRSVRERTRLGLCEPISDFRDEISNKDTGNHHQSNLRAQWAPSTCMRWGDHGRAHHARSKMQMCQWQRGYLEPKGFLAHSRIQSMCLHAQQGAAPVLVA